MGEIIKEIQIRAMTGGKPRKARFYFDSGSPFTFAKEGRVRGMPGVARLPEPRRFGGLGNGSFVATGLAELDVRLAGIWCRQTVYVVPDSSLEPEYDVLAGYDFMQRYHIRLDLRREQVVLDRSRLRSAQRVIKPRLL